MSRSTADRSGQAIRSLWQAVDDVAADAPQRAELAAIVARGDFRPAEDEALGFWLARFLSVREGLRAVIDDVLAALDKPVSALAAEHELRLFLVGYAAVCLLIRLDRVMLFDVAYHSLIQRKLNEAFPEYRIPRKQFTRIFSAFVDHRNVMAIRDAMNFAKRHRSALDTLSVDADVGFIARRLDELQATLNPSARRYLRRAWRYVSHKWRRRGVVSAGNLLAAIMEGAGRAASEIADLRNKAVGDDVRATMANFLQPGDVLVTRHARALTNLFIPGFWPHTALYIGTREQLAVTDIEVAADTDRLWRDDICVIEARKDGVRLRPLSDTLAVDQFVVLRPRLDPPIVHRAIGRALLHHGKPYNFDFDFFNSDRLVCTEVIYRAYDGLDGLDLPLRERAGRRTLSAEDLLDFALDRGRFEPVAVFGVAGCENAVAFGDRVPRFVMDSYRAPPPDDGGEVPG